MDSIMNKIVIIYYFCGRSGPIDTTCYRKNGFSKQDDKSFKSNGDNNICSHCERNGHTFETCYKKHEYPCHHKFYNEVKNICLTQQ